VSKQNNSRERNDRVYQYQMNENALEKNEENQASFGENEEKHDSLGENEEKHDSLGENEEKHDSLGENEENHASLEENEEKHDSLRENEENHAFLEKIEENLAIIANAMKNDTLEERNYKLQKKIFVYSLLGAIIGGLFTLFGVLISNKANILMEKNAEPYFQMSAIEENGETTVYHIVNTGGQIQGAMIILRSYIDIFEGFYTHDHYYFPCAEVAKTFSGQEGDIFSIDFTDTHFGIEEWTEENGMLKILKEKLDKANIETKIFYLETMEIQYIDAARNVVVEFYAIKEDESGKLNLYLLTTEYQDEIKTLIPDGCDFQFRNNDGLCRKIGSTGLFGSTRGYSLEEHFCTSVVEKLQEEISRKAIVTFG